MVACEMQLVIPAATGCWLLSLLISYSLLAQEDCLLCPCCHLRLTSSPKICELTLTYMLWELQRLINPEAAYLHPIGAMLLQPHINYTACQLTLLLMQAHEHMLLRLPLQDTHDMMWYS